MAETKIEILTESEQETKQLAKDLAPVLRAGDLISLTGDLGAGKTRFAQGLAEGLRIKEQVTSPTFVIIREYNGRLPLYHFDVYRLQGVAELSSLGYEDYFFGDGVTLIEWGDKVVGALPDDYLKLDFHRLAEHPNRRRINAVATGPRSRQLLAALRRAA